MPYSPSTDREHIALVLRTAQMYYEQELSQDEIAREIGYSRPTVSRLLAEARRNGIVQITVHHPLIQLVDAERKLRSRFGLQTARVAEIDRSRSAPAAALAADLISELGHDRAVITISNGTSVAAVVDEMPHRRWTFSTVVQMIGGLGLVAEIRIDSPELSRKMATRLGGSFHTMPVPVIVGKAATAEAIRHEPVVAANLDLAAQSDIAITGIGAFGTEEAAAASILAPYLTAEAAAELRGQGAVGHICGHFIDARGQHIRNELCERVIALEPERLAAIEHSILVAWGTHKVPAIRAALATGWISGLVTDALTATALLDGLR